MVTSFMTWWAGTPKVLRDFIEGCLSAALSGAAGAVYGLDLNNPALTPKVIVFAALSAAIGSVLAFARHSLATPTPTP